MPRSPLLHGLGLTIRHPRPLLWVYVFNAASAWLASTAVRTQFSDVTRDSLASQRLISGFDLGNVFDASRRLGEGPHGAMAASALGIPVYLLVFFLLVPGTLYTYQANTSVGLGGLLQRGVQSFWSFVRITLLNLLVAGIVVGIAVALQNLWAGWLDQHVLGEPGFLLGIAGAFVIFLVAAIVRLYFDLVEVHTVALSSTLRPTGRPDRRVRKILKPAFRTLRRHFLSSYFTFVLLALLGAAAVYLLGLSALHHLGQPRSWPTLLLAQLGLFLMLFTRFWQRAAETVLFQNEFPPMLRSNVFAGPVTANPPPPPPLERDMTPHASSLPTPDPITSPISPNLPGPETLPAPSPVTDPMPGPEPISPSLGSPDPGVFQHEVAPKKDLLN